MKKKLITLLSAAMMLSVMPAGCGAAAKAAPAEKQLALASGSVTVYDYGATRLHAFFTGDALADVAYIVEGKNSLIGIELPAFTAGLESWQAYAKSLGKPMEGIFICCHPAGASYIKGLKVYGTQQAKESIASGSTGATTQALHSAFGDDFHGGSDTADINTVVAGDVTIDGIGFKLIGRGETYDLAIPSLNVIYTHMLGKTTHSILTGPAHIDAMEKSLKEYQADGYDMILTSHGGPERQDAVAAKLAYLDKVRELARQCTTADAFKAAMQEAFPAYDGENYLDMTAGFLYK